MLRADGAGTIMDVSPKVQGLKKGDRVYAFGLTVNPKGEHPMPNMPP